MFQDMEKLKIISVLSGTSGVGRTFSKRPWHGLVLRLSGTFSYQFSHGELLHRTGDVLLIPQGSDYLVRRVGEEESRFILVNFSAEPPFAEPRLFTPGNSGEICQLMERMGKELLLREPGSSYECVAMFYRILALLHRETHRDYIPKGRSAVIAPALEYLKERLFDPTLRVEMLHDLCGVSDTYFRRIFTATVGQTPKKYILEKRLAYAKNILDSGEYNFVYEVANTVGFEDPLYFSKSYRAKYGYYPTGKREEI